MGSNGDTPPAGLPAVRFEDTTRTLPCLNCGHQTGVAGDATRFACPACKSKTRLARCPHCWGALFAPARINKVACPYCNTFFKYQPGTEITATEMADDAGSSHPDRRALVGCTVIG